MHQFTQDDSIGTKSPSEIAEFLLEIGDEEGARHFAATGVAGMGFGRQATKAWERTGLWTGYIEPKCNESDRIPVRPATHIEPDDSLQGKRLKITLDQFFAYKYPGIGSKNKILCEFAGRSQTENDVEQLKFAINFWCSDGERAALNGMPIFVGVNVGSEGIAFEGRNVFVGNTIDDALLSALESRDFQNGLSLLTKAQPALKPFVSLSGNVVKSVLSRKKNSQIFSFHLGLDFSKKSTSVGLRCGSYVVVQADPRASETNEYIWNINTGALEKKDRVGPVNTNYMIFGVTELPD